MPTPGTQGTVSTQSTPYPSGCSAHPRGIRTYQAKGSPLRRGPCALTAPRSSLRTCIATSATSAPGLGSPLPHLRRDSARPLPYPHQRRISRDRVFCMLCCPVRHGILDDPASHTMQYPPEQGTSEGCATGWVGRRQRRRPVVSGAHRRDVELSGHRGAAENVDAPAAKHAMCRVQRAA